MSPSITATKDIIPSFYKFFFLYFDPLCSSWGAYMCLFTPEVIMAAYNPTAVHTRVQDVLFQQLAGPYIMLVVLDIFLLRYTKDLYVWKVFEFSVTLVDAVILYSFYDSLVLQGRLPFALWEAADWANVGIPLVAGLVRLAFLAELGFSVQRAERVKNA